MPATAASERAPRRRDQRPTFVLVGGVPGAGKSTLLSGVAPMTARVRDPDSYRRWFARILPTAPYRSYRLLVHLLHAVSTLIAIVTLPPPGAPATLMVHNPSTRRARRDLIGRFAHACGWRTVLVLVDADRDEALAGQHSRGRVINTAAFERHWHRWSTERNLLTAAARDDQRLPNWDAIHLVDRLTTAADLDQLLSDDPARQPRTDLLT